MDTLLRSPLGAPQCCSVLRGSQRHCVTLAHWLFGEGVCACGVILIDNVNCAGLFTHLPLHIRARVGPHDVSHDDDHLNDAFICSETIKRTGN